RCGRQYRPDRSVWTASRYNLTPLLFLQTVAGNEDFLNVWRSASWVGLPLSDPNEPFLSNEATIRLRVSKPFQPLAFGDDFLTPQFALEVGSWYYVNNGPVTHEGETYETGQSFVATGTSFTASVGLDNLLKTQNGGLPLYNFTLDGQAPIQNNPELAEGALGMINIVPNPYYAFSEYETDALDNRVRIINLPQRANVDIYTVNGTLVRSYRKDDPTITSLDWDLKNNANIPIASGIYIVHVEVPGVGEKVLKWFGLPRTVDLNSF
ncbi:MAG: T9SS type A sorting domain-containing protein, partial [Bacteroidota bacterium]